MYFFHQRFICRPSDSTISEDAVIETQDCCDFGIGSQTLWPLGIDLFHNSARSYPESYKNGTYKYDKTVTLPDFLCYLHS